jgi:ATP-dependent Clp protease adapter protein ClpS
MRRAAASVTSVAFLGRRRAATPLKIGGPKLMCSIALSHRLAREPMVAFSPALEETVRRALAIAKDRRHERAVLDHLLLALTDDPDAVAVMRGSNVDIEKLRRALDLSLAKESTAQGDIEPAAAGEVKLVIEQAVIHVESIGRESVTGAHVLVEILDSWPGSFLREQGMTRYDATTFICHGIVKHAAASPSRDGSAVTPSGSDLAADANEAATSRVLLLNDDYTPMEFVVHVLEQVFDKDRESATQIMLHVHNHGIGACGTYPHSAAATKAAQVTDLAREHQHPLRCILQAD